MHIALYNSRSSLPPSQGDSIVVFAGVGSLLREDIQEIVTEVHCTYKVGDGTTVAFLRNGDDTSQRFEQAFVWAIKYALKRDIETVYGVFELSRPLDHQFLSRNCPDGFVDCRPGRGSSHLPNAQAKGDARTFYQTEPRQLVLRQRTRRQLTQRLQRNLPGTGRS